MLPIKFIDGNIIKNNAEEWWAYYSIEPYNYSFTNDEEKIGYYNRLNRLFNQVSTSDIHVLVPTIEENVSTIFEQSKKFAIGDLKDVAHEMLDDTEYIMTSNDYTQPPALKMDEPFFTGDTQLSTRFYVGFRLVPSKEDGGVKGSLKELSRYWADAFRSINHKAMGDFTKVSKEDLQRYRDIEHLTYSRISNNLKIQRLITDEIGYVVQHLNGSSDIPVNDYSYHLPVKESADGDSVCVKEYDILKLNNIEVEEHSNYLVHEYNGEPVYTTYLTISEFLEELSFPSSEIFYDQPVSLDFPVDTSIRVCVLENREALKKVRNQKARINDIDNHAWETGNHAGGDVDIAKDDIETLETTVKINRESMYTVSYIVRITAFDRKELRRRVNAVTNFYSGYGINMVCSSGDMMVLHEECLPSASLKNQLVHYFRSDFLACLGIGAGTIMGYPTGIPIGHTTYSQRLFCVRPWASAQGLAGTVSNSASMAFIGKMGGGKTAANNFYSVYSTLFGARGIIIDPKAERGHWKEAFPEIADEITISKLTADEANRGILDPYLLFENINEAEEISLEILTFLLGISIHDEAKYPALESALKRVSDCPVRGLLLVIRELFDDPHEETALVSRTLARQLESFARMGLSKLFMSDGMQRNTIDLERRLNIIQIDDLLLPEKGKPFEQYTSKETLSVAVMMVVSTFCLKFIRTFPNAFKFVNMDEAWSILNVAQGAELTNRLDREGRAMNAGVWYSTQNTSDLPDGKIKNSLGQVFIFRMDDTGEIKLALELLGVNSDDQNNIETIKELANGECIMKDLYGRVNKVNIDIVLPQMFSAFDTRPKNMNEQGE